MKGSRRIVLLAVFSIILHGAHARAGVADVVAVPGAPRGDPAAPRDDLGGDVPGDHLGGDPDGGAPNDDLGGDAPGDVVAPADGPFRRGDVDISGHVDAADAHTLLQHLNLGVGRLACEDAADANDDGVIDIEDALLLLAYGEGEGTAPMLPGPDACGPDPTPDHLSSAGYPAELCAIVPCCFPDGRCGWTCRSCCEQAGGRVVPMCLGDQDGDGADDACREAPETLPPLFIRSDTNADGAVDLSDAVGTLARLFTSAEPFPCLAAADANADGRVDLADPIATLNYAFLGAASPPRPFPTCGHDASDHGLGCDEVGTCNVKDADCDCSSHTLVEVTWGDVTTKGTTKGVELKLPFTVKTKLACAGKVKAGDQCRGRVAWSASSEKADLGDDASDQDEGWVLEDCGKEGTHSISFEYRPTFQKLQNPIKGRVSLTITPFCAKGKAGPARTVTIVLNTALGGKPKGIDADESDLDADGLTGKRDADPNQFNDRDGDGVGDGHDKDPDDPKVS